MKENKAKKGRGVLSWIILAVILVTLIVSSYNFVREWLTYKVAEDEYAEVNSNIEVPDGEIPVVEARTIAGGNGEETEGEEAEEQVIITYPDLQIDYDRLQEINEDFVGVLFIPALRLYYPVAHSHDNAEYLTRTFEGTSNPAGCIFLDCLANDDFGDRNTFIFGHNMKNETMFGVLKEFQKQPDLCDTDPYVYIYTKERVFKYHIFAYYTPPTDDDLYEDFEGDEGYDAYVKKAVERSLYTPQPKLQDDFTKRPKLLTLSTCYGVGHVYNFVVQSAYVGAANTAVHTDEKAEEGTMADKK